MSNKWFEEPAPKISEKILTLAQTHQDNLTKPQGSLGELETLAIQMAGIQNSNYLRYEIISTVIFAADHGISEEGVSAFPSSVTGEMVRNFLAGGAAISVLSDKIGSPLKIINCGTLNQFEAHHMLIDEPVAAGTQNFLKGPAMSAEQCAQAMALGKAAIDEHINSASQIFIAGEMGIANTSSATAICSRLTGIDIAELCGRGSGLDDTQLQHKISILSEALANAPSELTSPLEVMRHFGGFEIAALTAAYIRAAQKRIAILVDGFICASAALAAIRINPSCQAYMIFSHVSEEKGHHLVLNHLNATPVLNLSLRLGEGSGAALCASVLQSACALHNKMASFESADVSTKIPS